MARHDSSSESESESEASVHLGAVTSGGDAKKELKKEAKRAKAAAKKEAKRAKKEAKKTAKKRRRDVDDEVTTSRPPVESPAPPPPPPPPALAEAPKPKKRTREAFFAALQADEGSKGLVGTFHATGKKQVTNEEQEKIDEKGTWECQKCSYINFKECLTCAKCRALRRFEGRNQASGYCQ